MSDIENNYELCINYFMICAFGYYITAYIFCKSQNICLKRFQWVYVFASGALLSFLFVPIRIYNSPLSHFLRFILTPLLLSYLTKGKQRLSKSLSIGFICFNFELVCETIVSIIQGTLLWVFGIVPSKVVTYIFIAVFTFVFCVCFMRIKKFRRGFQFFQEEDHLGLGLFLASIVMILKSLNLRDNQGIDYYFIIAIFGIIVSGVGMYLWMRRSLTARGTR